MELQVEIIKADLSREDHGKDIVDLTAAYAMDPMGNGGPLAPEILERLPGALREMPNALVFLAYLEGRAVGIATCFIGFSTFRARPLVNVHDLAVLPDHRGAGIGRQLLAAVEREARDRGWCAVTLEVLENNTRARRTYHAAGFSQSGLGSVGGGSLFYSKSLTR